MPIIQKWPCGCLLPAGGVILGWVEIVINIAVLLISGTMFAYSDAIQKAMKDALESGEIESTEDEKQIREMETVFDFFNGILAIYCIYRLILLGSAVLLLCGSMNKKRALLLPYLITEAFNILWLFLIFIAILITIPGAGVVIGLGGLIVWSIYAWLCIISLFQEFRMNENRPADPILLQSTSLNPNVYTANPTTYPMNSNVYSMPPPSYSGVNYPRQGGIDPLLPPKPTS